VKLGDNAKIRTGLVLSRKEATKKTGLYQYTALTLKALSDRGEIDRDATEPYYATVQLKREYFAREGDILLRLSAPYTSTLISKGSEGLLISAHFTIIRANQREIDSYYLHWWLTQNRKKFYKQASGATMMGTISAGYVGNIEFTPPPIETQHQIAKLLRLSYREQELLRQLSTKKALLVNVTLKQIINSTGG
jgi:restriction endonuclease S subunit